MVAFPRTPLCIAIKYLEPDEGTIQFGIVCLEGGVANRQAARLTLTFRQSALLMPYMISHATSSY